MEKTIVDIFLESTRKFKDNVILQMVSEKKEEAIFCSQLRQNAERIVVHLDAWGIRKRRPIQPTRLATGWSNYGCVENLSAGGRSRTDTSV